MFTAGLIAAVLGTAPTGFTATVERVPLLRTDASAATLLVEPMAARLVIDHARLRDSAPSTLCPRVETQGTRTVLHCSTRRLWAELVDDGAGLALDVRLLRGLPWGGELRLPLHHWPVRAYGIPDECPGRLDATRGQCALALGDEEEGARFLKKARSGPDANFAYLRLAELAIARGQVEEAIHLLSFVPPVGPIGRLAHARSCELTGACVDERDSARAGELQTMDEPLKSEFELITWRREVLLGRELKVMAPFAEALQQNPALCDEAVPLCQLMLLAGLAASDDRVRAAALSGWLVQSIRKGPHELELAKAAAHAASELGAPGFAAAVLASVSAKIPKGELGAHLLTAAELYLAAGDVVRAGAIFDYAEGRLGVSPTSAGDWRAVRARLRRSDHPKRPPAVPELRVEELATQVGLASDLARAAAARSRAQEPTAR
jgi:hypothetical protein